jgi:hypothetical protein
MTVTASIEAHGVVQPTKAQAQDEEVQGTQGSRPCVGNQGKDQA